MNNHNVFAQRVAAAAKARDLTQTAIAKECGVTPQSVQRWFSGVSLPRPHLLSKLSSILDVPLDALIEDTPELGVFTGSAARRSAEPPSTSPLRELKALAETQKALTTAMQRHQSALQSALQMASRELVAQLGWEGYFQAPGSPESPGASFTVARDGVGYDVEVRVTAPSVADTARLSRAAADRSALGGITAYSFFSPRLERLRFFIAPNRMFVTREGITLLKSAVNVADDLQAGCITLGKDVETDENDSPPLRASEDYLSALFGDDQSKKGLMEWVDRFDLTEATDAAKNWELIRTS